MRFTTTIALILTTLIATPSFSNTQNVNKEQIENVEFVDTSLGEDFLDQIREEADQIMQEFDEAQDSKNWPSAEETTTITVINFSPIIITTTVLLVGLLVYLIVKRRKN